MDKQKAVWDRLWSQEVSYQWDTLSQAIFETICSSIDGVQGKGILEAGSGTGKISLKLAMENANVTLVDYSEKALENSQLAFRKASCEGEFVLSDIRRLQTVEKHYDLTWNAGVLEHFNFDEKVIILKEMARATKEGGTIIIMTPYSKCLPYRVGKAYAEKHGTWMYGIEEPVTSLKEEFAQSGITLLSERDIGFVNSLDFLDFIPNVQPLKDKIHEWYTELTESEKSAFPGYLLVSVGRVEK
ncbi:class I SAM-dependent methyltransferase [Cytobacillus purgationiresistens]|uniref:Ubiquinone/menaquinone biosynthesis C-methylase UbiE n=1 Tax=Cytobacillus purgationiresistens TaxID=863449 RepID=A0ABU0AC39_9BACI|nr:class I SAM-dependent methyltransferase [Cytobacillus purgationiresistens]MDQ0268281.1 ubiquinone/menaquinone biosynthesis C-methylase UbiE [Cytobacillus purgationiresistens]